MSFFKAGQHDGKPYPYPLPKTFGGMWTEMTWYEPPVLVAAFLFVYGVLLPVTVVFGLVWLVMTVGGFL